MGFEVTVKSDVWWKNAMCGDIDGFQQVIIPSILHVYYKGVQ